MSGVADFIRNNREALLEDWLERVRSTPSPANHSTDVLRDHLPDLLDRIADSVESGQSSRELEEISQRHARLRHEIGFDLRGLVTEYHVLRDVLLDALRSAPGSPDDEHRAAFHAYLDTAIMEAVHCYVEERERARQLFIGILGHDLRGPINTISLMTQRLLRDQHDLDPRQVKRISRVSSALTGMQRMIDELLDFTRGRLEGGFPVHREEGDLRELVEEAVEETRMTHPDRDVRLRMPPPQERMHGEWDWDRVEQALANLLSNAVRHGEDPIEVDVQLRGDRVEIGVANGGEVPDDVLPTLFDPFRTTTGTHGGGLGLGLYIAREIAHAHGGTVEVETGPEHGTRFTLVLSRNGIAAAS